MSQLAFDLDAMIHELEVQALPAWEGAPLHFTTEYHSPEQLTAAFQRYKFEHGNFACIPRSHMWHRTFNEGQQTPAGHSYDAFHADLRCQCSIRYDAPVRCQCVGQSVSRAICTDCAWHADGDWNTVTEAWNDHAWPGWRDLPIVPLGVITRGPGSAKQLRKWVEQNYPAEWQTPGAPVRTERESPMNRNVPGGSPFGGHDLAKVPA